MGDFEGVHISSNPDVDPAIFDAHFRFINGRCRVGVGVRVEAVPTRGYYWHTTW